MIIQTGFRVKLLAITALVLLGASSAFCEAKTKKSLFFDPNDGMFDMSQWLREDHGFLPVPMIITEPAVGFGLGTSLVFFHESEDRPRPEGHFLTPSMTGIFGAYTENDTWAGGAFHFGSWDQDNIRYFGGIMKTSVNLTYYGRNDNALFNSLDYNLSAWGTLQQILFRLPESNLFLGGRMSYFDSESKFNYDTPDPGLEDWEYDFTSLGLGPVFKYDTLDNMFTPNKGIQLDGSWVFCAEGADYSGETYQLGELGSRIYSPLADNMVLGWRVDTRFSTGHVPFFALPYIDMRGIPAARYQGEQVALTELELRYNLTQRWAVVGFGGVGKTADSLSEIFEGPSRSAGGVGLRYLVAKDYGIYSGLDVARGPEEWAIYLQVGSAWR
ncbi:MAG: hypothetical protein ACYSUT_11135 [Planctomycetota bacterium]